MNREIKFRAWDKESQTIIQAEERSGLSDFYFDFRGNEFKLMMPVEHDYPKVRDAVIMQFTGLKDKNGKEIYEGDIVRLVGGTCNFLSCGIYRDNRHEIGKELIVKWLPSGFTLCQKEHIQYDAPNIVGNVGNYDLWNHQASLEIIGNIYENPDLL